MIPSLRETASAQALQHRFCHHPQCAGDRDAALQTAAVQAGKTFTRTLAVYVTTQQLHRLSVVQGMLKHIDFSTASPTVRQALQKGTGAGNISALNKVMKGSLVTSLALVAVTTGPDMIKMLRGRISGAQFIRNLAVASSTRQKNYALTFQMYVLILKLNWLKWMANQITSIC